MSLQSDRYFQVRTGLLLSANVRLLVPSRSRCITMFTRQTFGVITPVIIVLSQILVDGFRSVSHGVKQTGRQMRKGAEFDLHYIEH